MTIGKKKLGAVLDAGICEALANECDESNEGLAGTRSDAARL